MAKDEEKHKWPSHVKLYEKIKASTAAKNQYINDHDPDAARRNK